MKITAAAFFILTTICSAQTTFKLYETTLTCDNSKKDIVNEGQITIQGILTKLVNENRLMAYSTSRNDNKEHLEITFTCAAESQQKFEDLSIQWKNIFDKNALASGFWKACPKRKDTLINKTELMYPLIKDLWSPVAVVPQVDERPDPQMEYNIVVDFTAFSEINNKKDVLDSTSINWGLTDLGRILNLHIAAGIPKEKIHFVAAVHGFATRSFLNNKSYQEKYKMDNPNIPLIDQLSKAGVKFLICGQSLIWMGYKNEMLTPQAKVTLTAQTTLSSYQLKGYALKNLSND